jgi:23S rRNA (guanosine2251-2'-O)-methyltransferase
VAQIEGRRPVIEALRAKRPITEILVASGARVGGALAEIVQLAERRGVAVREIPRRELEEKAERA